MMNMDTFFARLQRVAFLQQERDAEARGERVAGSPSRSFSEIAREQQIRNLLEKYESGELRAELSAASHSHLINCIMILLQGQVETMKQVNIILGKILEKDFKLPGEMLANLVLEYYPPELPIYHTSDGSVYTGNEMAKEIRERTSVGRGYASNLLRACRDLLARQAQKESQL